MSINLTLTQIMEGNVYSERLAILVEELQTVGVRNPLLLVHYWPGISGTCRELPIYQATICPG